MSGGAGGHAGEEAGGGSGGKPKRGRGAPLKPPRSDLDPAVRVWVEHLGELLAPFGTQAEQGRALSYAPSSISKWRHGQAMPNRKTVRMLFTLPDGRQVTDPVQEHTWQLYRQALAVKNPTLHDRYTRSDERDDALRQADDLRVEITSLRQARTRLEDHNRVLVQRERDLLARVLDLQARNTDLQAANADLRDHLAAGKAEREALAVRELAALARARQVEAELEEVHELLDRARSDLQRVNSGLAECQLQRAAAVARADHLLEELIDSREELDRLRHTPDPEAIQAAVTATISHAEQILEQPPSIPAHNQTTVAAVSTPPSIPPSVSAPASDDPDPYWKGLLAMAGATVLFIGAVCGLLAMVAYWGPDVLLTYANGRAPTLNASGQSVFWKITTSGDVDTTWTIPNSSHPTNLAGTINVDDGTGTNTDNQGSSCPGKITYTIYADTTLVTTGTLTFSTATNSVTTLDQHLPARPRTIRLTAHRTDTNTCAAQLNWSTIGLNAPGPGPFNGTSRTGAHAVPAAG